VSHSEPPFGGQDPRSPYQPQPGVPPQGYQPMPPPPPPRKRHRLRNTIVGTAGGLFALFVIIAAVSSRSSNSSTPATVNTPAATPAATNAARPSPATATVTAPKKRVLIRFTGSGIENSAPFNVGSSPLTVHYSFNCAAMGQAGNFIADLLYGNQAGLNSDDQSIANDLATSGAQTTTVYPQDAGKDYHLAVNSECSWRIRVSS
jgi:hypothetical protein